MAGKRGERGSNGGDEDEGEGEGEGEGEEPRLMEGEERDPIPKKGEEVMEGGEDDDNEEDKEDDVFCLVQRMDWKMDDERRLLCSLSF